MGVADKMQYGVREVPRKRFALRLQDVIDTHEDLTAVPHAPRNLGMRKIGSGGK
jgi:hypothetical protein